MNNWLVIGSAQNWETALSQPVPIWGLKPAHKAAFSSVQPGDTVWFYATAPVSGVIGLGLVKDKYFDKNNLIWEEERKEKKVIWPYRFRIQVLKVVDRQHWKNERIDIRDFNLFWQNGFQQLRADHTVELMRRFQSAFALALDDNIFSGATITSHPVTHEPREPYTAPKSESHLGVTHRGLQEAIAEIGKLQFYHSQLEYPIELSGEGKNLDAVWKREINGVPTFAFEVELSGAVEKAILSGSCRVRSWILLSPLQRSSRVQKIIEDRCAALEPFRELELIQPAA